MTQTGSRRCQRCGTASPESHRFCGFCGAEIDSGSTPVNGTLVETENVAHATNGATEAAAIDLNRARRRIGGTIWIPEGDVAAATEPVVAAPVAKRAESTQVRRRRKRRVRRWYRRPLVVAPLILLVLVGSIVGVVAYKAQSTLNSLHEVSTLPPQTTDRTEGDDIPSGLVFDTGPAQQALNDANAATDDGGGGLLGKVKNAAGDVGDLASGAAVAAGVKDPSKDAITILIMGVDARPGAPIDIGVRPDAMMVLYLNPTSGVCRGLAVPRDSLVELPGYGESKINHALMVAGVPYQKLVVENFLGIGIDHYALIDFTGFKDLVDAVGGVSINVPAELKIGDKVFFNAGSQEFDGEKALGYVRYRGGADVDVGRVRRQQQVIRGLLQVANGRNLVKDVYQILPALSGHVRTDMQPDELIALINQYRSTCSDTQLELDALQGDLYQTGTVDPLYQQTLEYVKIDPAILKQKVEALVRP